VQAAETETGLRSGISLVRRGHKWFGVAREYQVFGCSPGGEGLWGGLCGVPHDLRGKQHTEHHEGFTQRLRVRFSCS